MVIIGVSTTNKHTNTQDRATCGVWLKLLPTRGGNNVIIEFITKNHTQTHIYIHTCTAHRPSTSPYYPVSLFIFSIWCNHQTIFSWLGSCFSREKFSYISSVRTVCRRARETEQRKVLSTGMSKRKLRCCKTRCPHGCLRTLWEIKSMRRKKKCYNVKRK